MRYVKGTLHWRSREDELRKEFTGILKTNGMTTDRKKMFKEIFGTLP